MKTLGIIGFGDFGQFIVPHLREHFAITVCDCADRSGAAAKLGVEWGDLAEAAEAEAVLFAVPAQKLSAVLDAAAPALRQGALAVDLCSVKLKPLQLMREKLPGYVDVVGVHALFGPQSGKRGIAGLNAVLCPGRGGREGGVEKFLSETLRLKVFTRTAEEHDREMAYVQAVTHFVVRAIKDMELPDSELSTPAYEYLLNIRNLLGSDSRDLFLTIQNANPFAPAAREKLLDALRKVEGDLLK